MAAPGPGLRGSRDRPGSSIVLSPRRAVATPLGVLVAVSIFLALVSQWTIRIPQAGLDATFGFQILVCWLVVTATLIALLATNLALGIAAILAGEALMLGWFAWAMWIATTSRFAGIDFPFIGIDLVGPGWFWAALGLMTGGASVARRYHDRERPRGAEVWLLSAVPGMGLLRLGRTARGLIWALLASLALFLASFDSPVAPLFQPIVGQFDPPPAPPTRALDWILLGCAAAIALASIIDTLLVKARTTDWAPVLEIRR
jgi:hypothetical protein